uniref:Inter-alpha-trypsin inhibitor heavy chain H3 n=1 Tax=Takifugu rubripes TaxID=31033 RepID=A0A674N538_TAKRU
GVRSLSEAVMVEVYSVTVDCTVASRFARTVVTSKALNKANASQEIFFEVELPKTAFISNFSMKIDGRVYVGEVKEKGKAKREYEKAVSTGQTAGLVKASGRKMEKFSISVNIAANSTVAFVLTYEELLQRKMGQYEILTRVTPKQPVQEFQIVADIYEAQGLAFVEASATFLTNELLPLVKKTAHISFSPTLEQQKKCPGCEGTLIDGDFIIKYDVKRGESLGEVQIVNGYFVHFFAPPHLPRVPKNVVFVIDRSGSMSGIKMQQTREALQAILKDLHEEDHFALVVFDTDISEWRKSLTKATKENILQATDYVKKIKDRGSTALNGALLRAVNMLKEERKEGKLPQRSADMIITLTDGMPNHGESNIMKIQKNVQSAIGGNMSLFCLGFGNDVDYSFLDVMSRQNKGLARRIFLGSDAALQLQGFYDEVSSPLLLDVDLRYPENAVDLLTKNQYSQLFNGSEIVVSGQLTDNDPENFLVEVLAKGLGVRLEVSTRDISVFYDDKHINLLWSDTVSLKVTHMDLRLSKNCSLTVTLKHAIKFEVIKHSKVWKRHHDHQEYLGFYTLDSHHLSAAVHGLLGQFYHGIEFEVTEPLPKPEAIMYVKGQMLNVTRHWQKDFSHQLTDGKIIPCWFVINSGRGLIDGEPADYIVSGLFDAGS